jgi:hypothetical protein
MAPPALHGASLALLQPLERSIALLRQAQRGIVSAKPAPATS